MCMKIVKILSVKYLTPRILKHNFAALVFPLSLTHKAELDYMIIQSISIY